MNSSVPPVDVGSTPGNSSGNAERLAGIVGSDEYVPPMYSNYSVLPPPPLPGSTYYPGIVGVDQYSIASSFDLAPPYPSVPAPLQKTPSIPPVSFESDPHKINEAESLKFIRENDKALERSLRRHGSGVSTKGSISSRYRKRSHSRDGYRKSRENPSSSRTQSLSRSHSRDRYSSSSSTLSSKTRRHRSRSREPQEDNKCTRRRSRGRTRSRTPPRSARNDVSTSRNENRICPKKNIFPRSCSDQGKTRNLPREPFPERGSVPRKSINRTVDILSKNSDRLNPSTTCPWAGTESEISKRSVSNENNSNFQRTSRVTRTSSIGENISTRAIDAKSRNNFHRKLGAKVNHPHHRQNQGKASPSSDCDCSTERLNNKSDETHGGGETIQCSEDDFIEQWVRSAPSELYYTRKEDGEMAATERAKQLCQKFYAKLILPAKERRLEAERMGAEHMAKWIEEDKKEYSEKKKRKVKCSKNSSSSESASSSDDSDDEEISRTDTANKELERRQKHPRRMHEELWHNEPGQMNDGPVCRCSAKARRFGIRHGFYPGETFLNKCDPFSNNANTLFHYKILINPATNLVIRSPTVISHDGHEYLFEGFSIFSHYKLDEKLPPCRVIRFNIRYCMAVAAETFPQNFCVQDLKLFETYVFREVLELVDLKYDPVEEVEEGYCSQFHLMPRFARKLPDNGKEILSMDKVLQHLLKSDRELIAENEVKKYLSVDQTEWQDFADKHKGTVVVKRGMKPCAVRVDQIDRNVETQQEGVGEYPFPVIVHFGVRPPQLSYAGNVEYQRAWRRFVKYRHLLSNMPKPKIEDKRKLLEKDLKLQEMRTRSTMKRDVTVDVSAQGFRTTGVCCDLVQHAMLIPVLFAHLRFHKSLDELEKKMNYQFKNRYLLQLAMTHPSYRENFGTNPDHARNALTNCGIRQPEYGDRSIHYASSRKRGINTLIDIMARFGMKYETESEITHNERLEFLGDAVVEFITSIHLFHIFPGLEEGGLATYRAAIVQNQHLAVLAQNLGLDRFMLYAHGSDLCHDSELRHAMANCFEALMGALFLDNGSEVWTQIMVADRVFADTMYGSDIDVYDVWVNYPLHPLQMEEPKGDRHWVVSHVVLQKLAKFEEDTGIAFKHIRLLARAFTDRSLGYNNLSRGSNQRLEFLGDTVLQLIASEYLYRHFPDHHEGHLSLLRSSLVNNRTQAKVCDLLGMTQYSMRHDPKSEMKTKDRADLLEAFLGALYIDQGLEACVVFCSVCFFPRLTESIINQEWNDPKSKLQQCCLTLRSMDGKEPEIPTYKVTEVMGPTNTRVYKVAVYFKNKRLATSRGHSIQEAEMNAASNALVKRDYLFPQLKHQKRLLEKSTKKISQNNGFDD